LYYPQTGIKIICGLFGKSRQAWYKQQWAGKSEDLADSIIVKEVVGLREQLPRIGTRKLHYLLAERLAQHQISIGRDRLFDLLLSHGLLVRRRKRRKATTTDSNHPFRRYPSLIRELQVIRPCQLWVSDITYISLAEGFCYLSLITDAYSRKIVGYSLQPDLKKEGPLSALRMALAALNGQPKEPLIHHSDRGMQYCCSDYTTLLQFNDISISMTEKGDPYENAIAERVNGILKDEFLLDRTFDNYEQVLSKITESIHVYNHLRPHASCDYLTPEQAHQKQGLLKAKWKRRLVMT
jgi:putative transposase